MITYVTFFILLVSILFNIGLLIQVRSERNIHDNILKSLDDRASRREEEFKKELADLEAKWKEKIQKPQDSYELQQFLGDVLAGAGIVEVRRVAPTDVFIRSPRTY